MARHRNVDWNLPEGRIETWEQAIVAVLMDIREELQEMRRLMQCPNVARGFRAMQSIDRRLAKRYPLRKR